jgi:peroxiredoxin
VIDKKGVVRHILQDVNPKAHVDEVLKVCKTLDNAKAHAN